MDICQFAFEKSLDIGNTALGIGTVTSEYMIAPILVLDRLGNGATPQ